MIVLKQFLRYTPLKETIEMYSWFIWEEGIVGTILISKTHEKVFPAL